VAPARPDGVDAHHAAGVERVPAGVYLRPSKWSTAVRRRLFERVVPRAVALHPRADIEHVGSDYGGWPLPLGLLDSSSVVYSVGAGGDVTFDTGLIERFGCEVHSFDPTPEAAAHVAAHARPGLSFHNIAIWTHSGTLTMYRAANPANMALSAVDLQRTGRPVEVPCRTLEAVRRELGHEQITLIKLAVDGGEYELVPRLDLRAWGTRVLVVATHHNRLPQGALALVKGLRSQGFLPVARRGTGLTFARAALL
jgi:FkbM family methyltransferase